MIFTDRKQDVRRKSVEHWIGFKFTVTVFADRNQFIQSPTESCQIKFLLPGSDDPVHIIIAQTLRVVRDTGEMVELNIFRLLEVLVKSNGSRGSTYPKSSVIIWSDKTRFVTDINGISFQIIPVIDKDCLSFFSLGNIFDATCKSCCPDAAMMIFVNTIYIVITQTVYIVGVMLITSQFVRHTRSRSLFGTHQSVSFGSNPDNSFRVLQNKIGSAFHRRTCERNGSISCQISYILPVRIVQADHAVFQSDP